MTTPNIPTWLPADARKRRWLAVVLLVLCGGLIVAAVAVPAVLLHRHYDDNIAKLSRQLRTQSAFNALRPRLTEKLDALKARDVRKLFLKGTSAALALAELQESVRGTIEANGGRVSGSSVPGNISKDDGPYRQVATAFTLNASNPNLRRVLYALETKEPYLFIDTIVIQSQSPSTFRPAPGSPEPEMYIQLDVHSFALRAPSELAPPAVTPTDVGVPSPANAAKGRTIDATSRNKGGAT